MLVERFFNTWIRKFFLVLIALVLCVEFIGYVYNRSMEEDTVSNMMSDPVLNHKYRPNVKYIDTVRGVPNTIFANSQSWAEHYTVSADKPENTYRIFYVGDSTTHGTVNEGKRLPDIIENELNEIYESTGKNIEVINTGTSSYSTMLYYLLIKTEILKYDPDLVVINVDMTDIRDDYIYKELAEFDDNGLPIAVRPSDDKERSKYVLTPQGKVKISLSQRINAYIAERSFTVRTLEKMLLKIAGAEKPEPDPTALKTPGDWLRTTWDETTEDNVEYLMEVLTATIELLQSKDIKVMISGVPHYYQYAGDWSAKPHKVLAQTAEEAGVPYLNSYEALKDQIIGTDVTQYYWINDPTHFNEAGNAIWAEAQLEFIMDTKNNLLFN